MRVYLSRRPIIVLSIFVLTALNLIEPPGVLAADKKPANSFELPKTAHRATAEQQNGLPESGQTSAIKGQRKIPDIGGYAGGLTSISSVLPDYWETKTLAAYQRAIDENKILIIFFSADWCEWCGKLADEIKASKQLAGLQSCAIFLLAESGKDPAALALETALDIKKYPVVSFVLPRASEIYESGRINGFMPEEKFLGWTRFAIELAAKDRDASAELAADPYSACRGLAEFPVSSPASSQK